MFLRKIISIYAPNLAPCCVIGTYFEYSRVFLQNQQGQDLLTALIVVSFVVMAFDIMPPEIVFLVDIAILNLAEVQTLTDTISGFNNDSLVTIGTLLLVIGGIEKAHIIDYCARKAFGIKSSYFWGRVRMYVSSFVVSAWFNNIPQVAIMVPIVKDWAELRGVSPSQLLIPLSYSVLAGGMLATIGTSTNLVINGLLSTSGYEKFNFFDPAAIGAPAGIVVIMYMVFAGHYLLPHYKGEDPDKYDRVYTHVLEVKFGKGNKFLGNTAGDFVSSLGSRLKHIVKIRKQKKSYVDTDAAESPADKILGDGKDKKEEAIIPEKKSTWGLETVTSILAGIKNLFSFRDDSKWRKSLIIKSPGRFFNEIFLPIFFGVSDTDFFVVRESYETLPLGCYADVYNAADANFHDGAAINSVLEEGDTLFLASASTNIEKLIKIMPWEREGFTLYGGIALGDLPQYGHVLVEVVLSDKNPLRNTSLSSSASEISNRYKSLIISAREKEHTTGIFDSLHGLIDSHHSYLTPGSSILLLTTEDNYKAILDNEEFASATRLGTTSDIPSYWSLFPLFMFLTIISCVAAEQIEICPAAIAMAAFMFVGRWLTAEDIEKFLDIRLMVLLGASFSFAKAMQTTGLAASLATKMSTTATDPTSSLFSIYIATLVVTEVISNNAAAVLMYPIAISLAKLQGASYKPFAMVVMQASSMAFMCPIGYPTHIMVWRPGRYTFFDFFKFGIIPNAIWMILTCLITPSVWPF